MKNILFIDACPRTDSRTRELANSFLKTQEGHIDILRLSDLDLRPINEKTLQKRDDLCKVGDFSNPFFDLANQFKRADHIIIAAPYWDMSFPSILKVYIEHINVVGLTFRYGEDGRPISMSNAKRLDYVLTSGGPLLFPEFGYGYVKQLLESFYGVKEAHLHYAEFLDAFPEKTEEILAKAKSEISKG